MSRVLVVDDQQSVLVMIDSLLSQQGHVVTYVDNTTDAIDKLSKYPFDLLITDMIMPGGASGVDLIRYIKQEKQLSHLPVVMLSGRREKKDIESGIRAGAEDYIVKPIDPDLFIAKITAILNKRAPSSMKFAEVTIGETFHWEMMNELVKISEIGLTMITGIPVAPGTKMRISSTFLDKLGLRSVQVRVVSCEKSSTEPPFYTMKVHFIGITEESLQPLRVWIRNNQIKSA